MSIDWLYSSRFFNSMESNLFILIYELGFCELGCAVTELITVAYFLSILKLFL
jgi:hypothetical protein